MTPDEHTLSETFIEAGNGHSLYAQDWGNPKGLPVVFLHGGPGSGCSDKHRQSFDPAKHRVIFFDQRGSGRSLPYGSLEHNTTADLIADIEKISRHFNMPEFTLTGGSWGSCLALAYGLAYPKKVKAMVLAGIFTGSQSEIDYFDQGPYRTYFPDSWDKLLSQTPKNHHKNPVRFHYQQALADSSPAAKRSAYVCENLELSLLSLDDRFSPTPFEEFDPLPIRTEIYYMKNHCFMPDHHILDNAGKLKMPIWLIQGRYDMVCPGITAYELNKRLSDGQLIWTLSGHRNEREAWNLTRSILLQLSHGKK